MVRSLRKGITHLEVVSNNHYESINAIETSLELENNTLEIFTTLKPVDDNQKDDANYTLKTNNAVISKVIFNDDLIMKKLEKFAIAQSNNIINKKITLIYENAYFNYEVKSIQKQDNRLVFITTESITNTRSAIWSQSAASYCSRQTLLIENDIGNYDFRYNSKLLLKI